MQPVEFEQVIRSIVERDPRFKREAYLFIREALEYTQKMLGRPTADEIRHVTGRDLLDGIRHYALEQYGPMVPTVLGEWGIHKCEDVGEIVFNMVEANLLAKTETDSREDFKGVYDFDEVFAKPFRPTKRTAAEPSFPELKTK
ncbi:MAG: Minf_1886 family protein [Limisphaerales bacterium]